MTVAAALLAALATTLWLPPGQVVLAVRLGDGARPRLAGEWSTWRARAGRWGAALPVLVALATAPWLVGSVAAVLVLATASGVAAAALASAGRTRRRRAAELLEVRVAAGVELLAAELRTGAPPSLALAGVLDDLPELAVAARVAERGGDVASALAVVALTPGAGGLRDVGAAWRVAERSGAPIADVLDRVVDAARADRALAREVRAEGASARATARLLAALPLLGLGLGSGLGGDPVHVLLGTLPGAVCLAAGSALAVAGLLWVERIGAAAEAVR